MLITLVRDSVLQCFCHTCRVPVMPAGINGRTGLLTKQPTKIRSKQPNKSSKKVKFITTEIRCQEKSKGGLRYEVILAEPTVNQLLLPKVVQNPANKGPSLSAQEIEDKLKAAEERRLNLEAKKIADWSAKMAKIEEATRKKDELNNEFIIHTKEALLTKMEHSEEKREAIITDLKEKLKIHAEEIKRNKEMLEKQKNEERNALNDKLKTAANLRDENIKRILERLREHNSIKVSEVQKMAENRELQKSEQTRVIDNKLFMAEQNRIRELEKRLESIRRHERRAMIVRQNKAAIANQQVADDESKVVQSD
ncbi:unnamed protein product [Diamesa serratosioi]